MMKKKDDGTVFGIGIYRKEQWPLLLETAEDRAELEGTYEEWGQNMKKSLKNMRKLGMTPLGVDLDVNAFLSWCKTNGRQTNGESRAEFITELLRQGRGRKIEE
jgi:hypothetical protein